MAQGPDTRRSLRQNSSPLLQLHIDIPIGLGITDIHTSGQYPEACATRLQSSPMSRSIHAPCHTADDLHPGSGQFPGEPSGPVTSIGGTVPGSHQGCGRFFLLRQLSPEKEAAGCVRKISKLLRILRMLKAYKTDVLSL